MGKSIGAIAEELKIDPRRVKKYCQQLEPVETRQSGRVKLYDVAQVVEVMGRVKVAKETGYDRGREQARLASIQADLKALDLAQRQGELVEVSTVERFFMKVVAASRARLLSIPTKTAPMLAGLEARQIVPLLEKVIDEVLNELALLDADELLTENESSPEPVSTSDETDGLPMGAVKPPSEPGIQPGTGELV